MYYSDQLSSTLSLSSNTKCKVKQMAFYLQIQLHFDFLFSGSRVFGFWFLFWERDELRDREKGCHQRIRAFLHLKTIRNVISMKNQQQKREIKDK